MLHEEYHKLSPDERIRVERLKFSEDIHDKLQGQQKTRTKKKKVVETIFVGFVKKNADVK